MKELDFLKVLFKEVLVPGEIARGPTPSSILGAEGGIAAKIDGGQLAGRAAAGYLYNTALVSQTIAGARVCMDLGCGTAVQLLQIATVNPDTFFIGVDREPSMLQRAAEMAIAAGISNVDWVQDDLLAARHLRKHAPDALVGNMTLHDLGSTEELMRFGRIVSEMSRVTDAAVYFEDFIRLRHASSVDYFAKMNAPIPADSFSKLFRASLNAAFTCAELQEFARVLPRSRLYITQPVQFLGIIKTPKRGIHPQVAARLIALNDALPALYKTDFGMLRWSFALGGLRGNPLVADRSA